MRYIRSLNSNWFQNGKPSKLNNKKTVRFNSKTDVFSIFQLWRLAILEPVGVQSRAVLIVEFPGVPLKIKLYFWYQFDLFKWNFNFCQIERARTNQNLSFFNFQSQFSMPKISWIFLKMIFLYEHVNSRITPFKTISW